MKEAEEALAEAKPFVRLHQNKFENLPSNGDFDICGILSSFHC